MWDTIQDVQSVPVFEVTEGSQAEVMDKLRGGALMFVAIGYLIAG